MRHLIFGIVAVMSVCAAHAADKYVKQSCTYHGDGSSSTCAGSANGAGAYNDLVSTVWSAMTPGTNLYIVGTYNKRINIGASGVSGNPIVIRGDGYSGHVDGQDTVDVCISDNNTAQYIHIRDLEVSHCTVRGINLANGQVATNVSGNKISSVHVHDINTADTSKFPTCIWAYGSEFTVELSTVERCGDDGIWLVGKNSRIVGNIISQVGTREGPAGDCVQLSGSSSGFLIQGNTCNHEDADEKQCYITGVDNDSTSAGEISDNYCDLPAYGGVQPTKGIYNTHNNTVIARNFINGGESGIFNSGSDTLVVANVITGFATQGIHQGAPGYVLNNTVIGVGISGSPSSARCINSGTADGHFTNNIASNCVVSAMAYGGASSSSTWTTNQFWGNGNSNVPWYGTPATNSGTHVFTGTINADPAFAAPNPMFATTWRPGTYQSGTDVSAQGANAMKDHLQHPLPVDALPKVGAFQP